MNRYVVLRLLLTLSAFVAGAEGVSIMAPDLGSGAHVLAAALIAYALVLVPLAYQPEPAARASVAASLASIVLGFAALTPAAATLTGASLSVPGGILLIAAAVGQLLCLREASTGGRLAA